MKKAQTWVLYLICCLNLLSACAGNDVRLQNKIRQMSDEELVSHYQVIEMCIVDIDRKSERDEDEANRLFSEINPRGESGQYRPALQESHRFREEKKIILREMAHRGISPPGRDANR